MKILFIVPYPLAASASQRFRFEQYFAVLTAAGHTFQVKSFLQSSDWTIFFEKGKSIAKARVLLSGFFRRLGLLFRIHNYDLIFIHREAMPVGPPVIEWIIAKVFRKKIIYDFDDAIWLTDRTNESHWITLIKWRKKVQYICKWSFRISCGNEFLCDYARTFNRQVQLNPTTIDARDYHNPELYPHQAKREKMVIGWTGSHSTLKFLKVLEPALKQVEERFPQVVFLIIADRPPDLRLKSLRFQQWSKEREIEDLLRMDIGLMPLPDDAWSRGKCGFKALQYMSLGVPALVSPVGENTRIVDHGINGYHCHNEQDWIQYMEYLITQHSVCREMGKNGREKVVKYYSTDSNRNNFLSLFE